MKKVIVTGASGFLGSAVARELILAGYHVYATVHKKPLPAMPGVTIINGGIRGLTTQVMADIMPQAVFHCARPVIPRLRRLGRMIAAMQAQKANRDLLSQIAAIHSHPALIFASGSLVYGNSEVPHPETAPLNPISYAREYHRGEIPVLEAVNTSMTTVLMLRFPWLLGNGSWFSWFYLKPLMEKHLAPLFGDGNNLMSLISMTDAARLMVRYYEAGLNSGVYNIFSPHVITQMAFAELAAGHFGGSVTGYEHLYPKGVEKAVYEAFTSNILLATNHPGLLNVYRFQEIEEVFGEICNSQGINFTAELRKV